MHNLWRYNQKCYLNTFGVVILDQPDFVVCYIHAWLIADAHQVVSIISASVAFVQEHISGSWLHTSLAHTVFILRQPLNLYHVIITEFHYTLKALLIIFLTQRITW